jgi:drug/metabolite transporter (DMT)-like permease
LLRKDGIYLILKNIENSPGEKMVKNVQNGKKGSLRKGSPSVIVAAILWGLSFPVIKWGLQFIDFLSFLLYRFAIAATISLLLMFISNRKQGIKKFKALKNSKILLLGIFVAMSFLFQFWGQTLTTAGKASLFTTSNVIFVALFSHLIGSEKITRKTVLSVLVGIIGIYFLAIGSNPVLLLQGELLGDILSLISGLFWALYIIFSKLILSNNDLQNKTYGDLSSLDLTFVLIILSFIYLCFIDIFLFLVAPVNNQQIVTVDVPVNAWFAIIFLALFSTTIAYYLYFYGLERISAVKSSVFLLIEIITAVTIGILFLNELLTIPIVIGGLLIGLAILLID